MAWKMCKINWTGEWNDLDKRLKGIGSRFQYTPQKHIFQKAVAFPSFGKQQAITGGYSDDEAGTKRGSLT